MTNVRESAERVRIARERLRRVYAGESYYEIYGCEPTLLGHQQRDERVIIDAYIAEHSADDDEPVTEEWLRKMGFHDDPQPDSVTCLYWEDERGWLLSKGVHDQWYIYGNELPEESWPKTRGQLRRLLNGLGIETKA